MSVNVKWSRAREIKSTRGRGACRCERFLYRESRNVRIVRTWRAEGKIKKADLANVGTFRSCCFISRKDSAFDSLMERFLEAAENLHAEGALERRDATKLLRELADGLSEWLPEKDAGRERTERHQRRALRSGRRAPRRPVAIWMPTPRALATRYNWGHDVGEDVFVPAPLSREQADAYLAQLVTVHHRHTKVLDEKQREEIAGLFRGPSFEGLGPELRGPLQDLLSARSPRGVAEARLSLGVAAAAIRQRRTVEKIHAAFPSQVTKRRAFKALSSVMKGMVATFGDVWRVDLKFWKRANCYRLLQRFRRRLEDKDSSPLSRSEQAALTRVMSQFPDLQASFKASRNRSQREGLREFLGLRRRTDTHSLEASDRADPALATHWTSQDEAIARESLGELLEELTEPEREIAALCLEAIESGRAITQREVAEVAYPGRTPEAARREVCRARARIEPLIDAALKWRRAA